MVSRTRIPDDKANGKSRRRPADQTWVALKQVWRAFARRVPELQADLSCHAAAQFDRARLALSHTATRAVSAILLLICVAALFATAAVLVAVGAAGGVAAALSGNVWLANLITGMAVLVLLCSAIGIRGRVKRSRRWRLLQARYERHEARHAAMAQALRRGSEDQ
jgi:membrane protein implicated in regulation of membrane protease activity